MTRQEEQELLNIKKIINTKAGKKSKYIPKCLISYLERITHQEELNEHIRRQEGVIGVDFLAASMDFLDNKITVEGIENLPKNGLFTFVSNHPLGGFDGVSLGWLLGSHYEGKVKYLVNDILMNITNLAPLFVPVNKTGGQSRYFPQVVKATFASDNHIIMFPAGLCSRKKKGKIRDLEWKKTFIVESVKAQRDIVPIHFEGSNSNFFYRLANLCEFFHLKMNLAMIYLADEMFKNRHKTFKVTIGKPIQWETFDGSKRPSEWAQYVKEIVYKL
jgi:putative hemolysin